MKKPKISLISVICMVLICTIAAGCTAAGPADGQDAEFETVPTQTYISLQSVDNKLAIVYDDSLYLTEHAYSSFWSMSMSLDGKSAVCLTSWGVLYIHDGTVEKIADYAESYSFSVSGNAVAFLVDENNADRGNLESGLYLYHKESGQLQQVTRAADGEVQDYTLSPDGKTLAYLLSPEWNQCMLLLHQNGSSTLRTTFNNSGYRLISTDNSTDVIYLRTRNGALLCANKDGQHESVGRIDQYYSEINNPKGHLYLNVDHTQLLFHGSSAGVYLSEGGQKGVKVTTWGIVPVESALSSFHYGKNAVTCNVDDMKNQVMQANGIVGIQYLRWDESGQYVTIGECNTRKEFCWLDPTQRYVYYLDANKKLSVLDLQSGGESVLLAENVDHFAVSYDGSALYYANRYLYEYADGLQKYGGNLFKCDPANGTVLQKQETDMIVDLFFSENNQMFFLTTDGSRHTLRTVGKNGTVKTVLENVKQFTQDTCGLLFVQTDGGCYSIRGGKLTQLQVKSLA